MSDPWVEAGFSWTDSPRWAGHGFSVADAIALRTMGFAAHHAAILRSVLTAEAKRAAIETLKNMTVMNLIEQLRRQREWSRRTFGPGDRAVGIVEHIRRELVEVERAPQDLSEWIDVVLLALDGAWRQGYEPEEIAAALAAKQVANEARRWPDWRTAIPGSPIEHVRQHNEVPE